MKRHFPMPQGPRPAVLSIAAALCLLCLLAGAQTPPAQQQQQQQQQQTPPPIPPATGVAPAIPYEVLHPPTPPAQQQAPQTPAATPQTPGAAPATPPVQVRVSETDMFSMDNVSLLEMVDVIAKRLKINYILDKRVNGSVTIHTYGAMPDVQLMPLLQTILRVNGDAIVEVGNLYHIIPINTVSNLPTEPITNADPKTLPDDERMVLNMIFLKYTMADEMDKLLEPFMGEGARHSVYPPANLLIIEDNSRSMKRTMELIAMFDSDAFAGERVKLFDVTNSRPSDMVKELETVFKAYAYSDKNSAVHFIPIDQINSLLAVAPNPDVFKRVQEWIDKLDIPAKPNAGGTQVWTYRMNYGRAEIVAAAIMALYTGNTTALMQMAAMMNSTMTMAGMGMTGMNGMGMGMGGGYGGYNGGYGGYNGGYGGYGGYNGGYGGYNGGYNGYGGGAYQGLGNTGYAQQQATSPTGIAASTPSAASMAAGQTGSYMTPQGQGPLPPNMPHIIPNPFDNTLLVQGTAQDIEQIKQLVQKLDVPPRQVLIDAKIYEVDLNNEFADGVESYLQKVGSSSATGVTGNTGGTNSGLGITGLNPATALAAAAGPGGLALTVGGLVNKSNELIGVLNMAEARGQSRVISAPSVIATDSIPATMNVGTQVPTLSSQGVIPGVQSGGSSVFANTVSNVSSGVTLQIVAQVNSSGIVTMVINQQVSAPIAPAATSSIQSPSFSNRSVSTQVTVHDGDTIAIGGAILEQRTESTAGVPVLNRIPVLGALFGAKNTTLARTELIIFLTPRVIYDTDQITDATEEIRAKLKRLSKMIKDQ